MQAETEVAERLSLNDIGSFTKDEITLFAKMIVNDKAENGNDVLKLLAKATKFEHFCSEIKREAKEAALNDLAAHGRGGKEELGVQLTIKEVGVAYDYSNDPVWQRLNEASEKAADELTEQEKFLKAIPYEGRAVIDTFTGEYYFARPPARSGKELITCTIQKQKKK